MIKKLTVAPKGLTRHDPAGSKKGEQVDREKIRRILDHSERILYTRMAGPPLGSSTPKLLGNETSKWTGDIFREVYQAKTYLADRGSSPKMLLEHLAMALR